MISGLLDQKSFFEEKRKKRKLQITIDVIENCRFDLIKRRKMGKFIITTMKDNLVGPNLIITIITPYPSL